jgi:hypothetical protein
MKRSQALFVALIVFAFGALTVEAASAATFLLALWLVKGVAVAAALNSEAEGELLLEDTKGGLFGEAASVLCSGILVGTVNSESKDTITEVVALDKVTKISTTPLTEPGLSCTNEANCPTPLVWAVNLPWNSEVELVEEAGGPFFADLLLPHAGGGNVGWLVQCMGLFGEPEDECTAPEAASQLTLEGATLLGSFTEAFRELVGAPVAHCTRPNEDTGLVISDTPFGAIKVEGGEELTASSETSVS